MKYNVYAIKSLDFNYIYVGMTSNIEKRLTEHNGGKTKSNKRFAPFKLIHYKEFESRADVRKYEIKLKSGSGKEFLKNLMS